MKYTQRNAYGAAFKMKAINLAIQEGVVAQANESMVRRWRWQLECKNVLEGYHGIPFTDKLEISAELL